MRPTPREILERLVERDASVKVNGLSGEALASAHAYRSGLLAGLAHAAREVLEGEEEHADAKAG